MDSRVLTESLVQEFGGRVRRSTEVWFASAWVTASEALDDLVARRCAVRALVGTHGNATDPCCLQKIVDRFGWDSLRIVGDGGPLFHPKLYLFRRDGDATVAWIGSANFTGGGLDSNREILLESENARVVSQLEAWFDAEWRELRNQNVEAKLSAYRKRRRKMGIDKLTIVTKGRRVARLQFKPTRGRAKNKYPGKLVVSWADGKEELLSYCGARHALCVVLEQLGRSDRTFLNRCAKDRAFQVHHRDRDQGISCYLSRHHSQIKEIRALKGELGPFAKRNADGKNPVSILGNWWVSRDLAAAQVWKMIRSASRVARVELIPEADKCGL